MPRSILKAKSDVVFKKLFTENKDLLKDFISQILDIPPEKIEDITIINTEIPPESLSLKFVRLDLNLQTDKQMIDVEIQLYNDPDYRDRTLFYWAKLYVSDLEGGERYDKLKKAVAVNIIDFNMFDDDYQHREIQAVDRETGEVFSDKFSIHFFELKKLKKEIDPNNRKDLWLQFLNAEEEEEFEMIKNTNVSAMEKAVNVLYDMSEDPQVREMVRLREKALHDEASFLANARAEERSKIAENLRNMGLTEEQIKQALNT